MTLTGIIIILFIALLLIFLEVFVLPGINVVGILGIVLLITDIYLSYTQIGTPTAHYILASALLLSILILIFGLRAKTWSKLSLNTSIDGKIENFKPNTITVGDKGVTITRLGPMGKVLINGQEAEAKSDNIINAQTEIEVNNEWITIKVSLHFESIVIHTLKVTSQKSAGGIRLEKGGPLRQGNLGIQLHIKTVIGTYPAVHIIRYFRT